jgi:hypothetical protein
MFIHKILSLDDRRNDLIRWLSDRPRTYGEAHGMGIATGPTWDAALLGGLLTIEGVDSEDVVDGVTHPAPDARLFIGAQGYAELHAATAAKQVEPALLGSHLGNVDVEVADRIGLELGFARLVPVDLW